MRLIIPFLLCFRILPNLIKIIFGFMCFLNTLFNLQVIIWLLRSFKYSTILVNNLGKAKGKFWIPFSSFFFFVKCFHLYFQGIVIVVENVPLIGQSFKTSQLKIRIKRFNNMIWKIRIKNKLFVSHSLVFILLFVISSLVSHRIWFYQFWVVGEDLFFLD